MEESIIHKTKTGLFYKFAERIGAQGLNFLVTIVLARILLPAEFGVISLVAVFISILDVFVTYGFGNSLIANKNSDSVDFSTCFYFGGVYSVLVYIGVYFCAPLIASFFNNDVLTPIIRVMSLRIPIAAINSVQHAYVSKYMLFKKFFISTIFGMAVSGTLSIIMAYHGFGVWALVAQYLLSSVLDTVCLWVIVGWRPQRSFSFHRLRKIYDYGWKILVVGLIDTIYNQVRSLVIAKRFSEADLGFYSKGFQFPSLFVSIIEPTINGVIFPALSLCNDNTKEMKAVTRRVTQISCYSLFPLIIGLLVIATPLVQLLLTDKWLECVAFIQIGCVTFLFRPIQVINNCLIKASGRSALLLKLDILKKSIGIALLVVSIPFGIESIAWSFAAANIIATLINIYPNRSIIHYGYIEQFMDIVGSLVLAGLMGVATYAIIFIGLNPPLTLALQIVCGMSMYILLSILTHNKSYIYLKSMAMSAINKYKR